MPNLSGAQKDFYNAMIGDEMRRLMQIGQAKWYPNTEPVLDALKRRGHTLILLSNCKQDYLQLHRKYFPLDRCFSAFYCAEAYDWQPKYRIFAKIQEQFAGTFVIIGDRETDMEVAQRYGLQSIGCRYGYGNEKELRHATARIDDITELLSTI